MTFATWPLALIAAGIAIPALIILYFLKLRRRDMEVSSTLLWKKAIQDLQANAPFQKLRNNILLILQLLVLAAALFGLSQPEFKNKGVSGQRQIILIDRSASMSSLDGDAPVEPAKPTLAETVDVGGAPEAKTSQSRLDAAKKQAVELVNALAEPGMFSIEDKPEEAMVIAFDTTAEVVQAFTANKAMLRSAIESIKPTDAPTAFASAYNVSKAYTGTRKFEDQVVEKDAATGKPAGFIPTAPGAVLHIFSDGRLPDAARVDTAAEDQFVYHAIGSPSAINLGITGLRAERSFDNPGKVNIFVGLQSTDIVPRRVDVELVIDGRTADIKDVLVAAAAKPVGVDSAREGEEEPAVEAGVKPGIGGFVFPMDRPQGGVASVRLNPRGDDALAIDNVANVVVPPARRLSAVLVTAGNFLVQDALEGMKMSKFDVKSLAEFQKLLDADQLGDYDVFVFDKVLPDVKQADGKRVPGLPIGRSLVLGIVPPPPMGAVNESGTGGGEPDVVMDYQREHFALQLAAMNNLNIDKAPAMKVLDGTPVKVLARGTHGPLILEVNDTATQAIVVGFDPIASSWPWDPGFVLFLINSVLHLSQTQAGVLGQTMVPGETMATRLPRGAEDVRLDTPDGERIRLEPASDGSVQYGPIFRQGVYSLNWSGTAGSSDISVDGRPRRPLTVNLLDPQESDVAARPVLPMAREEVKSLDRKQRVMIRRLWPYLMMGALALVMLEWFVYNRKVAI